MDGQDDREKAGADEPENAEGSTGKPVAPPREAIYQALWVSYRDGVREKRALIRMHRLTWVTVNAAVEQGWPEKGWAALKDRAALWDRQALAAKQSELAAVDRAAAEARGKREAQTWATFKPQAIELATRGHEVLSALATKLQDAVKVATFVRYRRVRVQEKGRWVVKDLPYVDGVAVAQAARLWSSAFRENGNVLAFLTGGPAAPDAAAPPDLTPEQIHELEQGRLPEGMTLDMVAAAVMAAGRSGAGGEE